MPLLQDVKEIKEGMNEMSEKVKAIEIKVARLDVKVALGASLGSLLGGGTVALIVSQVSG